MKKIIAIGGGDIRKKATATIDQEIIRLTGKEKPQLLFIPTASGDSLSYWQEINKYFGGYWGCKTEVLFLLQNQPDLAVIERKILAADIVYVGGGNTLKMMRRWRFLGVDKILKKAYDRGAVMCGVSAGSICWFEFGHSDSMSSYSPDDWEYIKVRGLGWIKGIHCPHYDSDTLGVPRRESFQQMMGQYGGVGIALDDNCALEVIDGKFFKILTSNASAGAYKIYREQGNVISVPIRQAKELLPLAELYTWYTKDTEK